jgi:quinoprotein glucose dehydrogenase
LYPSLVDIRRRMTKDAVLKKIRQGGGKMPPFESVIKGKEEAIITFLFDIRNKKLSPEEAALLEIQNNLSSHKNAESETKELDSASSYINLSAYAQFEDAAGHPAIKPPWGTLNAINLNTGEYEWKVPVGNNKELQQKGAGITGLWSSPGPIVTAGGIVFLSGTSDKKFFAFDKTSGKLLWETMLPAFGSATPCSYMIDGKQYIAIAVAGDNKNPAGTIMAFSLP